MLPIKWPGKLQTPDLVVMLVSMTTVKVERRMDRTLTVMEIGLSDTGLFNSNIGLNTR